MPRVTVETKDHVATVTLSRADKMNAVDDEMIDAIIAAGENLATAPVRAVVLQGEGRGFCAGLDVASFGALAQSDPDALIMPRSHGPANKFQQVALVWRAVPVPVIAALHGPVFGAGLQLALGADIRIAHPEAQLAIMEMKWGLIPDMGGMTLLPALMSTDRMRKLIYTAAPIDARQAEAWGLVTEVSDTPQADAQNLAQDIAGKSPSAIRAAKRLANLVEAGANTDAVLLAESREQTDLVGKPHQMEVIAAHFGKRAARFD